MLGTALWTRFLVQWGGLVSDRRILRWVVLNSSHLKNRLAALPLWIHLGRRELSGVPIPGSTFQNLCTILCSTCVCIQKSQNFCILLPYLMHKTLQGKKPGEVSRRLTLASSTESKRQHPGQNNGVCNLSLLQRNFPKSGIEPRSPTLQADSLPAKLQGKPRDTGVGSLFLLQQIFLAQESNWVLLHWRQILYQLSHQGSKEAAVAASL